MKTLHFQNADKFREYISQTNEDFFIDTTSMNFFDSMQFLVLSSVYYKQKEPEKKFKCKTNLNNIEYLLNNFKIQNIEFI